MRARVGPWRATAAVLALALGLSGCAGASRSTGSRDLLVPSHGAYLGMYYGDGSLASTVAAIGRTPAIHLTYVDWTEDWTASRSVRADLRAHRIPLVNWEPFGVRFADIVRGRYDDLIRARARGAKALGAPFYLDVAAEMNEEEGWGGHRPKLYIAAWRHIHDIFTDEGATDAVWVWAPNNTDSPDAPPATAYYPGSDYVDWVGIDGYNWGTSDPDFDWQSFADVFGALYDRIAAYGKPVMIGETASDDRGGSKPEWIADLVPTLKSRFPRIHALVWFDVEKERHWRIRSSDASLAAFRELAADPYIASR